MVISNFFGKNSYFKANENISNYLNGSLNWRELDKNSQEEVVKSLIAKVNIIAHRIKSKLPSSVDIDDLISAGSLGLIEGLINFDGTQNTKLETFVETRIKGAILDELRRQDWLSRGFRKNIKVVESVLNKIEQEKGREPLISEISEETGLTEKEIENCLEIINNNLLVNLDMVTNTIQNKEDENPIKILEKKEVILQLSKYIQELTEKEQLVLSLYYVEELTMKEIAEVLNITEGRVSQLHSQAIKKLRKKLKGAEEEKWQKKKNWN